MIYTCEQHLGQKMLPQLGNPKVDMVKWAYLKITESATDVVHTKFKFGSQHEELWYLAWKKKKKQNKL